MKVLPPPRPHAIDEILEMAIGLVRTFGILDDGAGLIYPLGEAGVRDAVGDAFRGDFQTSRYELTPNRLVSVRGAHVSFVAVKEIAGAPDAAGFMGKEVRKLNLEQGSVLVFKSRDLDIRSFLIRIPCVDATSAVDLDGVDAFVESPARDIEVMDARVTDVGGRGIPKEVPAVVKPVEVEWAVGRGAEKEVPVNAGRDFRVLDLADAGAAFEDDDLGAIDFAQMAFVEIFHGGAGGRLAAHVQTRLDDAVILARGLHHFAAFLDRV